jgi:RNA polymerase sigma-70 factor (ECF subfamily)
MGQSLDTGWIVIEDQEELTRRALAGDTSAVAELFDRERPRLKRMVRLRLDSRLGGRVDADDVLQEASLDVLRRLEEFRLKHASSLPLVLWFRLVVGQRLIDLHRLHLGTRARDAALEVSLHRGSWPQATSASLAAQLLGKLTSASRAAIRAEQRLIVQEALNRMDALDREVLVLRHFEHLTNDEVAALLGLKKTAASQRYVRALQRLGTILAAIPGLNDAP